MITNSLPVKEGAADQIVERFAESRGHVQDFPGFVSVEVLRSEDVSEVLVQRGGATKRRSRTGCTAMSSVHYARYLLLAELWADRTGK